MVQGKLQRNNNRPAEQSMNRFVENRVLYCCSKQPVFDTLSLGWRSVKYWLLQATLRNVKKSIVQFS